MNLPNNPSESFRKLNPHLFGIPNVEQQAPEHNLIRQSAKPLMNQLETEFHAELVKQNWKVIIPQSLKFRLANGCWYCPDFITHENPEGFFLVGWEIKGSHIWEDSIVKLKVVATQYPFIQWRLAHKIKGGSWGYQLVLP